jgi:anti-sigma-K factor RskA
MARSKQQDIHELVGAYALDALEPDEAQAFELHLAECPKCRAESREHRETAALLAHVGADAPAGVWDRIAAELGEAPAEVGMVLRFAPTKRGRLASQTARRFMIAAVAAAAALIGINSAVLVQQRNEISDLKPSAVASLRALADKAMDDPASRIAVLRRADGVVAAEAVVTADGHGYLVRPALAGLDADHAYQLWGLTAAGRPVSLGVLGARPTVTSFTANVPIKNLAITVEEAAGALTPTGTPVVSGSLQSE